MLGCALAAAVTLLGLAALAAPARATYLTSGELSFDIVGVGTVAGTDYEPAVVDGALDLDGVWLEALVEVGQFCNAIETLPNGNTYTLISTTGDLTGVLRDWRGPLQDGDTVGVTDPQRICFPPPSEQLEIHYHRDGPVKTVTGTVVNGPPTPVSQVRVAVSPDRPQTNEPTTITATVTTSSWTPQGTIAFGAAPAAFPVDGCAHQPLVVIGGAYVATCTIGLEPLLWGWGPHIAPNVTATFVPDDPTQMRGATGGQLIGVAAGRTATQLELLSGADVTAGSLRVAATVVPAFAGTYRPLGSLAFSADGAVVANCSAVPLASSGPTTASCSLDDESPGKRTLIATYVPTSLVEPPTFVGSTSAPLTVTIPHVRRATCRRRHRRARKVCRRVAHPLGTRSRSMR